MMELLSRIRALLRRSSAEPSPEEYRLGPLAVNPKKHMVRVGGQDVAPVSYTHLEEAATPAKSRKPGSAGPAALARRAANQQSSRAVKRCV